MVPKLQALQRPISATNWQNVTSINHESEVWAALNLKWRNPKPFLGTPCSVGTNALSQRRVITTGAGFSKTGTPTVHFVLFAANKAARGQCGLNQVKYPCSIAIVQSFWTRLFASHSMSLRLIRRHRCCVGYFHSLCPDHNNSKLLPKDGQDMTLTPMSLLRHVCSWMWPRIGSACAKQSRRSDPYC